MGPRVEIQLIAAVVAVACALPGTFLVLRRMAMMSDAISHAILLGIVLAFFAVKDLASPLLVVGAALTGVATVSLVSLIERTGLVREDAAIGLVFTAFFSAGVILVARHAGKVHLDTDAVLLGELAFAPFNRLVLFGSDAGPKSLWVMSGILILNALFILVFYKELKVATFDAPLAGVLGFAPGLLHYGLMTLVSVTAVGAFDAVGSILVVALMIAPPATAYLVVDRLSSMLLLGACSGVASALGGYWAARWLDASIAGSMATVAGILFVLTYVCAPERGLVAGWRRRRRQRVAFAVRMLAVHLFHHEGLPEEAQENSVAHLHELLRWEHALVAQVVRSAERAGIVIRREDRLFLTGQGRHLAGEAIAGEPVD